MTDGIVTLLFTDLVGSTELLDALGDDEFDRVRREHFRLLRDRVTASGGREVKSLGDGLMVVIPSAVEGVRCAVAVQEAVAAAAVDGVSVRVGLHVGDPIRDEDDYFGTAVVVARRLCDRAAPGQILASTLVRDLVGRRGGFEFEDVGPLELKGLSSAVGACSVAWSAARGAPPLPTALGRLAGEPFVGRDDAMADLRAAWDKAAAGTTGVVLVSGEPGIGKTRLAAGMAHAAHEQGAIVLYGRCDEDNVVPHQPFVEALNHLLAAIGDETAATILGGAVGDLARLLPDLPRRLPSVAPASAGDPETARYLMFEAVTELLAAAGSRAPLLVILDDLHWADAGTLRLLRHLLADHRRHRLLVVGTYRDTDLDRAHPLAGALADLRRDGAAERISIAGLSEAEVGHLLEQVAGHELDGRGRQLAAALHRETEGNPFFVREVVRHLVEVGVLYQRGGRWTSDLSVATIGIPEGVREVIGRRLSRLDDVTNEVLGAAAVLGREFTLADLTAVSGRDGDELVPMLDAALAAAVLTEVPGAVDRWSFTHALVRQTLVDELSTSRRVRLHRKAARAIEAAGEAGGRVAELAHHYIEAADDAEGQAVTHIRRAAEQAVESLAWEEAVRLFDAALDMLDGDDDPRVRAEILAQKGAALWAFATSDEIKATFDAAIAAARTAGAAEVFAEAAIASAGPAEAGINDTTRREAMEEALALLDERPSLLRARLLARLAAAYFTPGVSAPPDAIRSAELAEAAERMAREVDDPLAIADVARSLMFIAGFTPTAPDERRAAALDLVDRAREIGDADLEATGWAWVVTAEMLAGRPSEAEAAIERYDEAAARLRRPFDRYWSQTWRAAVCLFTGRLDEAARLNDDAFAEFASLGHNGVVAGWGAVTFVLRRWRGGLEDVVPVVEQEHARGVGGWGPALGFLYADLGRMDDARAILARLDPATIRRDPLALLSFCLIAATAEVVGDGNWARIAGEEIAPFRGGNVQGNFAVYLGSSSRFLGAAAEGAGDVDGAVELYRQAAVENERMGGRPWVVEAQLALVEALRRRGRRADVEEADAVAADALRRCAELGMPRLAERLRR